MQLVRSRSAARKFLLSLGGLMLATLTGTGCGPDCYSTCNKLYGSGSGGEACAFTSPNQSSDELLDLCVDNCQTALLTEGEVGAYNPYEKQPGDAAIELNNDRQAALWMDCVDETACEKLDEGYCAPVW